MPRHKHADVIIAWAIGEQIQYKHPEKGWLDYPYPNTVTPSFAILTEYRVKPPKILYRRYVTKKQKVHVLHNVAYQLTPKATEAFPFFSHWIDTDWIEA